MTAIPLDRPPEAVVRRRSLVAPLVAAGLALLAAALHWRGVDLPAQIYRVTLFRRQGLTLWDSQWYGGHFTFDYSVIFPPIAAVLGVQLTGIVCAATSAWAFDRLAIGHFGPSARVGSYLFAAGTVVQMSIGQLPFLMGEAFALCALGAAARKRWPLAVILAMAASLASPLAAAFLGLAAVAWLAASWPRNRLGILAMCAGAALPIAVAAVMFPGQGSFPYPRPDFLAELVTCLGVLLFVPRKERALWIAAHIYVVAAIASFILPTPMGGNIGRLMEIIGVPIAACMLWPVRRWALAAVSIPLAIWQWTPAVGAMTTMSRDPSTHQAFYQPLVEFLEHNTVPIGRVEVVPTHDHWEAAYVAPSAALARGWERQLDTADNPIFYDADELNATTYYEWLINNGVRFVALPQASLDYAGEAEAKVVEAGVTGLQQVWSNSNWRVFKVLGSTGVADGPGAVTALQGGSITVNASAAGTILVRVHDNPDWAVTAGAACLAPTPDGWMTVHAAEPGPVALQLRLVSQPASQCPAPAT